MMGAGARGAQREEFMASRDDVERLLRGIYAARQRGDLDAICEIFAPDARLELAGSHQSPAVARTHGHDQLRSLVARMIQTFEMLDHSVATILVDGGKAAVQWRATLRSSVTGEVVTTDLFDLIEIENGRVKSCLQFCDTALAEPLLRQP
jgi:ketosteroid isomerase-like protein